MLLCVVLCMNMSMYIYIIKILYSYVNSYAVNEFVIVFENKCQLKRNRIDFMYRYVNATIQ